MTKSKGIIKNSKFMSGIGYAKNQQKNDNLNSEFEKLNSEEPDIDEKEANSPVESDREIKVVKRRKKLKKDLLKDVLIKETKDKPSDEDESPIKKDSVLFSSF